jgi:ERCC4-related helicase
LPRNMQLGYSYWSEDHEQFCQILEIQELFGELYCRVWLQQQNIVTRLLAEKLLQADIAPICSCYSIRYLAAAAKVTAALAEDLLLAPIQASVIPLPHQLRALSKALAGDTIRYLLADEVGLGKTIEAGLILRELKLRGSIKRILIVAPKGLVSQWVSEMKTHFNEDFRLVLPNELKTLHHLDESDNLWKRFSQVVCPMDSVKPIESRRGRSRQQQATYNQERFGDLIAADWDLVIVDEAHRLAGSSDQVARYRLGQGLADAAPYLLLLSATPHQGKTEAFYRLMALLDRTAFPNVTSVTRERVQPYVIRTPKRQAIDSEGKPLFQPRHTQLIAIAWKTQHRDQKRLYEAVSDYAREGYNQARKQKQSYVGFLMILMQRLVTSSTRAIRTSLERRLEILREPEEQLSLFPPISAEEFYELDGQEQFDTLLGSKLKALKNERIEVELLLELARCIEVNATDAKSDSLLDWIYHLQQDEADPNLKVLIFTEFVPTQQMLAEFLSERGISVVCLNGSMDLGQRKAAQESFARETRVLISTDAGGEGLNLQFCHVIVNYDIPWNPMRLEQRIGRVDRIGQKFPVRALNFVFEDTVEYRVREVLEEKLEIILREFGVDKTGDVLDSAQAGELFDELFVDALMNPEDLETKVTQTVEAVRLQAQAAHESTTMYESDDSLDPAAARQFLEHPLHHWVEVMTISYIHANRGHAMSVDDIWQLRFPTGENFSQVTFDPLRAEADPTLQHFTLEQPLIRGIIENLPPFTKPQPVPCLDLPDLSIHGIWSLWRLRVGDKISRIFPLFLSDDGRRLSVTARHLWERLINTPDLPVTDYVRGDEALSIWDKLFKQANEEGQLLYEELERLEQDRAARERQKHLESFASRRSAIERVGLPQVRTARLQALDKERLLWEEQSRISPALPDLFPLLVLKL